ncbi:MAG: Do family serine endopeptidase [Rickettsiales bacterium]|nr:MAG: Do family serine endopeptidase [Rickettsiales bacterium]
MQKIKLMILSALAIFNFNISALAGVPVQITSFADIVEPLMPTVVNIYTVKHADQPEEQKAILPEILPVDKLNNFLEQFNVPFSFNELSNSTNTFSLGSGVIVDSEGYIITNDHVVAGSDEIFVKLYDNTEMQARIIGSDPKTDLALLKIDAKEKLPRVEFVNSNQLRVGDVVIAIGNPFGFGGTVTTGIISSKGRDLGIDQDELVDDFLQTDAAINTGNSGGPLFNIEGKLIGLNTALPEISGGTNIGIGFAIPSNTVQAIMKQLKEKGKISRGRLDITVQQMTTELAEALSINKSSGVLVVNARPGGVGDKAGLKRGDLITEFNGNIVLNSRKLQLFVADCHIGDQITLTVIRDNKPISIIAKIEELEPQDEEKNEQPVEAFIEKSGISFSNISPSSAYKYGINNNVQGIVVTDIKTPETNLDLQVGDVIISINQQYISDIDQFNQIYEEMKLDNKKNVVLLVKRQNLTIFVAFPISK